MKLRIPIPLLALEIVFVWCASAQSYDTNGAVVQTFAGSGFSGYVDGVGLQTMFSDPRKVVANSAGNLFVLDFGNSRIRKITPGGTVSTFAGGGAGSLPGYGTNVSLGLTYYSAMAIDHSDALWIPTSSGMLRIRSDAYVTKTNLGGLSFTSGVCVDSGNNIYYSGGNQIYRWGSNGVAEVFAGSGNLGAVDGNGIFTSFSNPGALAADAADNIYVWDTGNFLIRKISQNRDVATIAGHNTGGGPTDVDGVGTNAAFGFISAMCVDNSGNLILGCGDPGSSIRKMTATTNVTTIAGSFTQAGYTNGTGSASRFRATGVCVSQGMIFVADYGNQRIRNITFNPSTQPVLPANLQLNTYSGLQIIGTVGRTYQIESSPDMGTWTTCATLLLNSSPYLWIDQNPVNGTKFYRALLLP